MKKKPTTDKEKTRRPRAKKTVVKQSPEVKLHQDAIKLAHKKTKAELKDDLVEKKVKVYKPEGTYPEVFQKNFKKAVAELERESGNGKSKKAKAKAKPKAKKATKTKSKVKKTATKSIKKAESKPKAKAKSKTKAKSKKAA